MGTLQQQRARCTLLPGNRVGVLLLLRENTYVKRSVQPVWITAK